MARGIRLARRYPAVALTLAIGLLGAVLALAGAGWLVAWIFSIYALGVVIGAPLTALGYFAEFVAWTVGFGAAILYWYESQTRFGHQRPATATPAPPVE